MTVVLTHITDFRLFPDFIHHLKSFLLQKPLNTIFVCYKNPQIIMSSFNALKYIFCSKKYHYLGKWMIPNTTNWIIFLNNRFSEELLILHPFILLLTLLFDEFITKNTHRTQALLDCTESILFETNSKSSGNGFEAPA